MAVANSGNPATGDDGNVSVLLGNGDGTFQSATNAPAGKNPFTIATGDFNRDDKADLVLIDANGVGVLQGRRDGTFGPLTYFPTVSGPLSLAVADCNGDNTLDLVVAAQSSLSVLLGNGDGTFRPHVDYPAGGLNVSTRCVDFSSGVRREQRPWLDYLRPWLDYLHDHDHRDFGFDAALDRGEPKCAVTPSWRQ